MNDLALFDATPYGSGSHDELPYDPDPAGQWDGLVQRAKDGEEDQ